MFIIIKQAYQKGILPTIFIKQDFKIKLNPFLFIAMRIWLCYVTILCLFSNFL